MKESDVPEKFDADSMRCFVKEPNGIQGASFCLSGDGSEVKGTLPNGKVVSWSCERAEIPWSKFGDVDGDVRLMIKNIHKAMKILFDPIPNLTSVESDHSAKPDHMSKSYVSSKPACLPNPVNSEKPVSNRSGGYQGQGYRGNQDRGNKIPKNIASDRGYASNQQKGQYQGSKQNRPQVDRRQSNVVSVPPVKNLGSQVVSSHRSDKSHQQEGVPLLKDFGSRVVPSHRPDKPHQQESSSSHSDQWNYPRQTAPKEDYQPVEQHSREQMPMGPAVSHPGHYFPAFHYQMPVYGVYGQPMHPDGFIPGMQQVYPLSSQMMMFPQPYMQAPMPSVPGIPPSGMQFQQPKGVSYLPDDHHPQQ